VQSIDATIEQVAEAVSPGTLHGWHSSRLLKFDGALYFMASKICSEGLPVDSDAAARTLVFRRDLSGGDAWDEIADIPQRCYTSVVDPRGRMWAFHPWDFNRITVYRSGPGMDLETFVPCYDGTCFYGGTGVDATGNCLILHSEDTNHMPRFPNRMMAAFYDAETDSWHRSRMETPEGRFGYVGIVLHGRSATAMLQSTIYDPTAAPSHNGYNWRLIRLARCEDLRKGAWVQRPFLMPAFGETHLYDMIEGPDGQTYISYKHRGGEESFEAIADDPKPTFITRVHDDLSTDVYELEMDASATRLFIDSAGQWYMVGHLPDTETLHLWRLDPEGGFKPTAEWVLNGTESLRGHILHTLRPERFGGEGSGDTVHLVTAARHADYEPGEEHPVTIWHGRFDLPSSE